MMALRGRFPGAQIGQELPLNTTNWTPKSRRSRLKRAVGTSYT
jgi:hypothetical protein